MKRFIVISLASIGGLALLLVVLVLLSSAFISSPESTDFNLKTEASSPDAQFRAAHFVGMGGGAAGWCNEVVTVQPASARNRSNELTRDFKVFSVSCGSDVQLRWNSNKELVVSFSLKGRSYGASTYMRPQDSTGKIHVRYGVDA
jgi:hypothetical protein